MNRIFKLLIVLILSVNLFANDENESKTAIETFLLKIGITGLVSDVESQKKEVNNNTENIKVLKSDVKYLLQQNIKDKLLVKDDNPTLAMQEDELASLKAENEKLKKYLKTLENERLKRIENTKRIKVLEKTASKKSIPKVKVVKKKVEHKKVKPKIIVKKEEVKVLVKKKKIIKKEKAKIIVKKKDNKIKIAKVKVKVKNNYRVAYVKDSALYVKPSASSKISRYVKYGDILDIQKCTYYNWCKVKGKNEYIARYKIKKLK